MINRCLRWLKITPVLEIQRSAANVQGIFSNVSLSTSHLYFIQDQCHVSLISSYLRFRA